MQNQTTTKAPSIRLTSDMRQAIVKGLLANALDKRVAAHDATGHKLAAKAYNARYSAADRKLMASLPEGWLPTSGFIYVTWGAGNHQLYFGPQDAKYNRPEMRVRAKDAEYHDRFFIIDAKSDLAIAVAAWLSEDETLTAERRTLKAKAEGVVERVTTVARLIEVWPEAAPFCPQGSEPRLLPVVRREELNTAFKLPVKSKAAA